jgi:hypothetical protein
MKTDSNNLTAIHQPDFFPHIDFFVKANKSKQMVILDNVQFQRRGWTHRDKILTNQGVEWITVPIKKTSRDTKILKVEISKESKDYYNIIKKINFSYAKTPFFNEIIEIIIKILNFPTNNLCDFNLNGIYILFENLSIKTEIILQSNINVEVKNNELLINIMNKLNSKNYLSGLGAKSYLNEDKFKENGINIFWNKFNLKEYPQLNNKEDFVPNLSIIDILFNCGIKKTKKIISDLTL